MIVGWICHLLSVREYKHCLLPKCVSGVLKPWWVELESFCVCLVLLGNREGGTVKTEISWLFTSVVPALRAWQVLFKPEAMQLTKAGSSWLLYGHFLIALAPHFLHFLHPNTFILWTFAHIIQRPQYYRNYEGFLFPFFPSFSRLALKTVVLISRYTTVIQTEMSQQLSLFYGHPWGSEDESYWFWWSPDFSSSAISRSKCSQFQWNTSISTWWTDTRFWSDTHGPQTMNPTDVGDPDSSP